MIQIPAEPNEDTGARLVYGLNWAVRVVAKIKVAALKLKVGNRTYVVIDEMTGEFKRETTVRQIVLEGQERKFELRTFGRTIEITRLA